MKELESFIDNLEGVSLYNIKENSKYVSICLHKTLSIFKCIPQKAKSLIAKKLDINMSIIEGVSSFYSFFNSKIKTKHIISICDGTVCSMNKLQDIMYKKINNTVQQENKKNKNKFKIQKVMCFGMCSLSPIIKINDDIYTNVKEEDIEKIIKKYN